MEDLKRIAGEQGARFYSEEEDYDTVIGSAEYVPYSLQQLLELIDYPISLVKMRSIHVG